MLPFFSILDNPNVDPELKKFITASLEPDRTSKYLLDTSIEEVARNLVKYWYMLENMAKDNEISTVIKHFINSIIMSHLSEEDKKKFAEAGEKYIRTPG